MTRLRQLIRRSESNTREVARGGAITASAAGVGALATFGLLIVVTRGADLASAGLFFEALALVSACSMFTSLGASTSMTRAIARIRRHDDHDASPQIWAALLPIGLTSVVVAVCGYAASSVLARHLTDPSHAEQLGHLVAIMFPAVPLMALTRFFCAISRAVDDPLPGALFDLGGQPLLRFVVAGGIVALSPPQDTLAFTITGPALLCFLGSALTTRRALRSAGIAWSLHPVWHAKTAGEFWRFSGPRGLEEITQASNIWLLTLMVGVLASPVQTATYAAITRYTIATTLILQSVTTALLPRLAATLARDELEETNRLFQLTTRWIVLASIPICLCLLLFPTTLIHLVDPKLPEATAGLRWLAVGSMVNVATGAVGGVILMAGRSTINLGAAILGLLAMVLPAVPLVNAFGASGAAIAWSLSLITQNTCLFLYGWRKMALTPWSGATVRLLVPEILLISAPMVVSLLALHDRLLGCLVGGVISTALAGAILLRSRGSLAGPST